MKQTLLSLLLALLPLAASADAVEIGGIYYNLIPKGKVAEVTSNPKTYKGTVVIPDSVVYDGITYFVTSIGLSAFTDCSELLSVIIPNSVKSIGYGAFNGCIGLTSIEIPNSVTNIGNSAFSSCGLTSITIPNSVTSIGQGEFFYCSNLESVILPNSVTSIESDAFAGCSKLKSITIPHLVTSIEAQTFIDCTELTSVTIGNSVASIDFQAFYDCKALTSINIPNSVTKIGNMAFYNCSGLTSITLGNSVQRIASEAFFHCPELTDIYCYAEAVPNTHADAFKDSYIEYVTLHVPANSVNAYKSAEPWKNFKEIVPIEDVTLEKCATPTIAYANGEFMFSSETEGVEFVSEITISDAGINYTNKVSITGKYKVSVYATKEGYENSDVATKTIDLLSLSGDVSGDGEVDATDITKLIDIILQKNTNIKNEQ